MAQLNKKIIAVAVAVLFCVLASLWPQQREESAFMEEQQTQIQENIEDAKITVYVSGAVLNPGLHEIATGSRAVDAIAAAGGMTEEAQENTDRFSCGFLDISVKSGYNPNVRSVTSGSPGLP